MINIELDLLYHCNVDDDAQTGKLSACEDDFVLSSFMYIKFHKQVATVFGPGPNAGEDILIEFISSWSVRLFSITIALNNIFECEFTM